MFSTNALITYQYLIPRGFVSVSISRGRCDNNYNAIIRNKSPNLHNYIANICGKSADWFILRGFCVYTLESYIIKTLVKWNAHTQRWQKYIEFIFL